MESDQQVKAESCDRDKFADPSKKQKQKLEEFSACWTQRSILWIAEYGAVWFKNLSIKRAFYYAAVEQLFMDNVGADEKSRKKVVRFVVELLEKKIIAKDEYLYALQKTFQKTDDLINKIPNLFKNTAAFYVTILKQRYIELSDVCKAANNIFPKYGPSMLKELLLQYEAVHGKIETMSLWLQEESFKLTDFVQGENLEEAQKCFSDAKLGYLLDDETLESFTYSIITRLDNGLYLIFLKAIYEPKSSEAYAIMCKNIVPMDKFGSRLLILCDMVSEFLKSTFKEASEETRVKVGQTAIRATRFIGELYLHQILTTDLIHSSIQKLIEYVITDQDELALECLRMLFIAIGSKMEKEDRQNLDAYFEKLTAVAQNEDQFHNKVRARMQDVFYLRENNWLHPERHDLNLKTTNQTLGQLSDELQLETQWLFQKFRSVLNKLTAENFDELVNHVRSFAMDTNERINGCADLLIKKAISEPMFSGIYARLCKEIGTICTNEKPRKHFKSCVLQQCQERFEGNELKPNEKLTKEAIEDLKKVRFGTIRFIGELYKHGQLTVSIMHSCIKLLMKENIKNCDEETLECLCILMSIIGSKMEDSYQELDPYFEKLVEIVQLKQKSGVRGKIICAIQDVVDLRSNGWTPRRQYDIGDKRTQINEPYNKPLRIPAKKINIPTRTEIVTEATLYQLLMNNIERDDTSREMIARDLGQMFEAKAIEKADYLRALEKIFLSTEDLILDLPQLFKHITTFYVMLLKQRYIALGDICDMLPFRRDGAAVLKELLLQYQALYGQEATLVLWYESALKSTDFITTECRKSADKHLVDAGLGYLLDLDKVVRETQAYLLGIVAFSFPMVAPELHNFGRFNF